MPSIAPASAAGAAGPMARREGAPAAGAGLMRGQATAIARRRCLGHLRARPLAAPAPVAQLLDEGARLVLAVLLVGRGGPQHLPAVRLLAILPVDDLAGQRLAGGTAAELHAAHHAFAPALIFVGLARPCAIRQKQCSQQQHGVRRLEPAIVPMSRSDAATTDSATAGHAASVFRFLGLRPCSLFD